MTVADVVKSACRRFGVEVSRYRPPSSRRAALMAACGVETVVDVGANTGQYGRQLRRSGFAGDILSFEPLAAAYDELARATADDPLWWCSNVALSDRAGSAVLNVAANSASSSLLVMAQTHREAAPDAQPVGVEEVALARLDDVAEVRAAAPPLLLKLDVQGHEAKVLLGAADVLPDVVLIEAELSVVTLYEGAPRVLEMLVAMSSHGFELASMEPGFHDPRDGRILQFDGMFRRSRSHVRTTRRGAATADVERRPS